MAHLCPTIGVFSLHYNIWHRILALDASASRPAQHMVHALASDRSDQPLGEWRDGLVTDAHGSQSVPDGNAVDLIPIVDQVARRLIPRECLGDLACDPVRARIYCDVDPDEVSAGQPDDDEGIEGQDEAEQRDHTAPTLGDSLT
jgi:hypothetical protein